MKAVWGEFHLLRYRRNSVFIFVFLFNSYGYNANQADEHETYYFSKPKFQIYPYSQHDIAPTSQYQQIQQYLRHNQPQALVSSPAESHSYYQNQHTSVEIQPSRSYEIKETPHGYQTLLDSLEQQDTAEYHHQMPVETQPAVPVIVLRIPGPQKYASHLQALLQQYLEIRAAQYIQVLQEQEAQQLQQQQQQHQEVPVEQHVPVPYSSNDDSYLNQPVEVGQTYPDSPPVGVQQDYGVPQPQYVEQSDLPNNAPPPPSPIETHSEEPQAYGQFQMETPQSGGQSAAFVYQALQDHAQQQEQIVYGGPRQPVENPLDSYGVPRQSIASTPLLTSENYPDDKHTQVVFRSTTHQPPAYHYDSSSLHSHSPDTGAVEVQTFRAPLVYHRLEQFYGSQPDYESDALQQPGHNGNVHPEHHHNGGFEEEIPQSRTPGSDYVTITQRPVLPYNYHAQSSSSSSSSHQHKYHSHYNVDEYPVVQSNNVYKRSSAKRHAHSNPETPRISTADRQRKFTNLMHRLKARVTQSNRYDTIPL